MLSKMFRTSALIIAFSVLACTAWAQSIEVGAVNPARSCQGPIRSA